MTQYMDERLDRERAERVRVERLDDDELETILIIASNGQSGRITEREVRILVEGYRKAMACCHCGNSDAPHDTVGGPMCSDCLSACVD